jgi:hypothetical protein
LVQFRDVLDLLLCAASEKKEAKVALDFISSNLTQQMAATSAKP